MINIVEELRETDNINDSIRFMLERVKTKKPVGQ